MHRDLTANNVLLTSDMMAKIADLGQARIIDRNPAQLARSNPWTKCPGNVAHMPPEALLDTPTYDAALDVFSFGVVMLHTLTQEWPEPSADRVPGPGGYRLVKEVERWSRYLNKIDNPLLKPLVIQCLNDTAELRPSAGDLVGALDMLMRLEQTVQQKIQEVQALQEKLSQKRSENQVLQQKLTRERNVTLHLQQELEQKQQQYEQLDREMQQYRKYLGALEQQPAKPQQPNPHRGQQTQHSSAGKPPQEPPENDVLDSKTLAQQMGLGYTELMQEQSEVLRQAARRKKCEELGQAMGPEESLHVKGQEHLLHQYSEDRRKGVEMEDVPPPPIPTPVILPEPPPNATRYQNVQYQSAASESAIYQNVSDVLQSKANSECNLENITVTQEVRKLFQQYPELAVLPPWQKDTEQPASDDDIEDLYDDGSNPVPVDAQPGPPAEEPCSFDVRDLPPPVVRFTSTHASAPASEFYSGITSSLVGSRSGGKCGRLSPVEEQPPGLGDRVNEPEYQRQLQQQFNNPEYQQQQEQDCRPGRSPSTDGNMSSIDLYWSPQSQHLQRVYSRGRSTSTDSNSPTPARRKMSPVPEHSSHPPGPQLGVGMPPKAQSVDTETQRKKEIRRQNPVDRFSSGNLEAATAALAHTSQASPSPAYVLKSPPTQKSSCDLLPNVPVMGISPLAAAAAKLKQRGGLSSNPPSDQPPPSQPPSGQLLYGQQPSYPSQPSSHHSQAPDQLPLRSDRPSQSKAPSQPQNQPLHNQQAANQPWSGQPPTQVPHGHPSQPPQHHVTSQPSQNSQLLYGQQAASQPSSHQPDRPLIQQVQHRQPPSELPTTHPPSDQRILSPPGPLPPKSAPSVSTNTAAAETINTSEIDQSDLDQRRPNRQSIESLEKNLGQDNSKLRRQQPGKQPARRSRFNAISESSNPHRKSSQLNSSDEYEEGDEGGSTDATTAADLEEQFQFSLGDTWICSYCTNLVKANLHTCDLCGQERQGTTV